MIEFLGLFNPIPPTVFCDCLEIRGRGQIVPEIFLKRKLYQLLYNQYHNNKLSLKKKTLKFSSNVVRKSSTTWT